MPPKRKDYLQQILDLKKQKVENERGRQPEVMDAEKVRGETDDDRSFEFQVASPTVSA